jgi:hypothetical protein
MQPRFKSRGPEPRATFTCRAYEKVIAVTDLCRGRSVTNDAEAVIAQLAENFDLSGYRVIYRDTRGIWDELCVRDGRFDGFRSINERELEAALLRIAQSSA